MADLTFRCRVITPESAVVDTEADFAAIPAHDGEIGILRNRAPLLCRLGIGVLRLETDTGQRRIAIDAGFAQVIDNTVTLVTEGAWLPENIDVEAARASEQEARQRKAITQPEQEARRHDIAVAAAKIKAASK